MASTKIKQTWDNRLFYILDTVFLYFMILVVILPLMHVVSVSLSSPGAVSAGRVLIFPVDLNFNAYGTLVRTQSIITGMLNTIYYTFMGTVLNIFVTIICAYPLSRKNLPGKKFLLWIFTFTMMFGGGLIPSYLNIRRLGLLNTRWAMIIPGAMSVWNMIITRTFFINTIPDELIEAAEIDGASDFQCFIRIVMPNSVTIVAIMALFYAVGHWNQYYTAMLYLNKPELYNLQLVLRNIIASAQALLEQTDNLAAAEKTAENIEVLKYAVIVFASLPIMLFYPFVQKYFVKGVMVGSLKG